MESALSSLIIFAVGLFAAVTISHTYLETQDALWAAERASQAVRMERERTNLEILQADTQSSGAIIQLKVRNNGQVKLADFEKWDVIVQYYSKPNHNDYKIHWLPYTSGPVTDLHWTVSGIYIDSIALTPEAYDRNILNPDEEMIIQIKMTPPVPMNSTNRVIISTPNGITISSHFSR